MSATDGDTVEIGTAPPARPTSLHLRLPARPGALAELRHRTGAWLAALEWPPDDLDDLNLAIAEACTNAVEHAYGNDAAGDVSVTAHVEAAGDGMRRVVVVVRDRGRWRAAPDDPGFRGHGLRVMQACVAEMSVRRDLPGTAVTLVSTAVPLLAVADGRPAAGSASAFRRRSTGVAVRAFDPADRRRRRVAVQRRSLALQVAAAQAVERAAVAHRRARELTASTATHSAEAAGMCAAGARRRAG